jgi:hypothetical protein
MASLCTLHALCPSPLLSPVVLKTLTTPSASEYQTTLLGESTARDTAELLSLMPPPRYTRPPRL